MPYFIKTNHSLLIDWINAFYNVDINNINIELEFSKVYLDENNEVFYILENNEIFLKHETINSKLPINTLPDMIASSLDDIINDFLIESEFKDLIFANENYIWNDYLMMEIDNANSKEALYYKIEARKDKTIKREDVPKALYIILKNCSEELKSDSSIVESFLDQYYKLDYSDLALAYNLPKKYYDMILKEDISDSLRLEIENKYDDLISYHEILKNRDIKKTEEYYFKMWKKSSNDYSFTNEGLSVNQIALKFFENELCTEEMLIDFIKRYDLDFCHEYILFQDICPEEIILKAWDVEIFRRSILKNINLREDLIEKLFEKTKVDNFNILNNFLSLVNLPQEIKSKINKRIDFMIKMSLDDILKFNINKIDDNLVTEELIIEVNQLYREGVLLPQEAKIVLEEISEKKNIFIDKEIIDRSKSLTQEIKNNRENFSLSSILMKYKTAKELSLDFVNEAFKDKNYFDKNEKLTEILNENNFENEKETTLLSVKEIILDELIDQAKDKEKQELLFKSIKENKGNLFSNVICLNPIEVETVLNTITENTQSDVLKSKILEFKKTS